MSKVFVCFHESFRLIQRKLSFAFTKALDEFNQSFGWVQRKLWTNGTKAMVKYIKTYGILAWNVLNDLPPYLSFGRYGGKTKVIWV